MGNSWRGHTECVDGQCRCKADLNECVTAKGVCAPAGEMCERMTGNSITGLGCIGHLGAKDLDGKCMCDQGSCAVSKICVKESHIKLFWWLKVPVEIIVGFALVFWCVLVPCGVSGKVVHFGVKHHLSKRAAPKEP